MSNPVSPPSTIATDPEIQQRSFRIFIIEDEEEYRDPIQQWLEAQGYEVEVADTHTQAIKFMSNGYKPDLILLDYSTEKFVPCIDGGVFMEEKHNKGVPVISISCADISIEELLRHDDCIGDITKVELANIPYVEGKPDVSDEYKQRANVARGLLNTYIDIVREKQHIAIG